MELFKEKIYILGYTDLRFLLETNGLSQGPR